MFQWNMQFNTNNPEIVGDLEIKPRGVASVMQKEVRSQRLTSLLQTVANPMLAPFIKIPNLIRELAIAQDIDPETLVNDINDAAIFAEMLKGLNAGQQQENTEKLKGLVNSNQWEPLKEHLQTEMDKTHRALVMAQSEQEMFRNQGKAILLGQLLRLRDDVNAVEK